MRRGPRAKARRQRAASHINAIESGPPETARTIAGAAFQSANRRFAFCAEIGEWSSSVRMTHCKTAHTLRSSPRLTLTDHALTLDPLLLTVHGRFNAARGARIFPCHLAERGTGGLLLLQGRKRLSEPQQGVRSFRRFIEFGGHAKERFRSVTVLLALEETLAQPVLGICHQGIAGVFLREAAHRRLGQRIVLALHIADAEIELILGSCRWRQGGNRTGRIGTARRRQCSRRTARSRIRKIERLSRSASARSADRRFGRDRELPAAERTRRARGIWTLAGIEGIATAPALPQRSSLRRSRRFLDDRRRRGGNLRIITRLGLWLSIDRS